MSKYINVDDFLQDAEPALTWDILAYLHRQQKTEIVRCKDCLHSDPRTCAGFDLEVRCHYWNAVMNADDFCSCGKGKG